MKYLFIIQGEGRGHLSQALALLQILQAAKHEVCCMAVGISARRSIPTYFYESCKVELITFRSPNFVTDPDNKSVKIPATLVQNISTAPLYLRSLQQLHSAVQKYQPDIIINFYDLLGGIYFKTFQPAAACFALGHQYLLEHPDFPQPAGHSIDRHLMRLNNRITAGGAQKIALSFTDKYQNGHQLCIAPPLVRREYLHTSPTKENFILCYIVNAGYAQEIISWHQDHRPQAVIHCFWDHPAYPSDWQPHPNITFHPLNGERFTDMMCRCNAYASTAGFESICEAALLGKPIMMVPVAGHYEQLCNALDAEKVGIGILRKSFDLSDIIAFTDTKDHQKSLMSDWIGKAPDTFLNIFTSAQHNGKTTAIA